MAVAQFLPAATGTRLVTLRICAPSQQSNEVLDHRWRHRPKWGQEVLVGFDDTLDTVRSLASGWPVAMVLIVGLPDEIRSDQNAEEIREIRTRWPVLSVLGGNAEAGESVRIHMPVDLPRDLRPLAPQLRDPARVVAGHLQVDAESQFGIKPYCPSDPRWDLGGIQRERWEGVGEPLSLPRGQGPLHFGLIGPACPYGFGAETSAAAAALLLAFSSFSASAISSLK